MLARRFRRAGVIVVPVDGHIEVGLRRLPLLMRRQKSP